MGRLRQSLSSSSKSSVGVGAGDALEQSQDEAQPEYILKELYSPHATDDGSSEQDLVDLVFVHGLGGNLRTTWKIEGSTQPWFTDERFLGRLKDSVRCLSFGYNANRFGDVANTRIIHHANDLLRNLVMKRLDNPNRPIIFIAHSLGGLVVKRAILLCATNNDWSAIKDSTKSIIFMGTPHMGSEKAEDLVVVQKLASLLKLQSPIATNLTKELRTFSNTVQDINMEFTFDVHRNIELLCCYESHPQRLPNGSSEIIVPQWSAVLQGVDNIDLNCHHSGLPKFKSPLETRFELFWGEVQRLVRKATAPPQKLLKAPTWTDEEVSEQKAPRVRQVIPSRRRHEAVHKGIKPSRASIIRSSADEILKEVRSRISAEDPTCQENLVTTMKSGDFAETIDPREFTEYIRQLRTVTPENRGVDRELPHWQTCKWILTDPKFLEWKESDEGGLLFITGNPGCGKSNMAKFIQGVMEEASIESEEQSLVISFYCDSLESSRANPPILDLVVKSLLGNQRTMSRTVRQKLQNILDKVIPDRQKAHAVAENDKMFNHLLEVAQTLVLDPHGIPAYLIIDGLDQCEDSYILRLLRGIDSIFRREGSRSNLKVLITSRMADSIRGFALANAHINVTHEIVEGDIQRVVDEEVDRIIAARQIASIGVDSVSAVIVERSNGSFLFATSVLKELWLIKDTGPNSVFTLVTSCPPTMEAMYQHDMDRLETERPDLFRLVQIICIVKRAIRIPEAREILRMQNPDVTENYDLFGDLTKMCQRLIKFGSEDTLELLHQTLYDYIINTYDVSMIHEALAEICLQYLSTLDWDDLLEFSSRYENHRNRRYQIDLRYPMMDYASSWMGYHWRHAGAAAIPKAWDIWGFLCSDKVRKWQSYSASARPVPAPRSPSPVEPHSNMLSGVSPNGSAMPKSFHDWDKGAEERAHLCLSSSSHSSEDKDSDDDSSDAASSVSGLGVKHPEIPGELSPKPPLVILAQWDVDHVIRTIFADALDPSPRAVLRRLLSNVPYVSPRSTDPTLAEFRVMINEMWDGTTAVHFAAAQTGRALKVMLPYVNDINLPDDEGATPLILAAASGEDLGVSSLLAAGAEINRVDKWNQTALYSALHSNSAKAVEMLLQHGADPNIVTDTGYSALEVAVGKNQAEFAQLLLEYSADVAAPMTNGQPPAFLASKLGSHEALEVLLPYIDVNQIWDGERIIHNSCWRGLEGVVRKLIKLGANLNDPPLKTPKATPVALAAECGHNSLLRLLLAAGAHMQCPLPNMSTPLHIAVARGNLEACEDLILAGCNIEAEGEQHRTPLYVAADANWPQVVEFLVSYGADPNKPTFEPPLQVAVDLGSLAMVQTILSGRHSPDVDAKGDTDETALGIACNYGDVDILNYLLDHGADPNLRSGRRTSNTPLHLAARSRCAEAMIELLKRGANVYPESSNESSAFHTACLDGLIDVVKTSLEVVDDEEELINFEWGWYGTPLLQAALGGQLEVVEFLLSKGADPDYRLQSKVNNKKSIIHGAAEGGNIKVLEAILAVATESNIDIRDFKQRTPLYYACVEGHEEMVDYLLEKGARSDVVLIGGENLTAGIVDGGSATILDRVLEKHPDMDVDVPREDQKTPLFYAVLLGHEKMIKTLLDRGVDANRRSTNGQFPLSDAIRYRKKKALQILLDHGGIDLAQIDVYGRNILQIAQQSGSRHMPSMILVAAKTPEMETFLLENRDMFGKNARDYARIDLRRKPSWDHCIESIRKDAQSLLVDFSPRGARWERLGKFFLQLSAYSWATIAFQRNVEAIETTPLFLEHQVQCRLCLDLIPGVRYTCRTCCNLDMCRSCVEKCPSMGYRMWTCEYHTFFQVRLPGRAYEPSLIWGEPWTGNVATDDQLSPTPLSPIAEEAEGDEDLQAKEEQDRLETKQLEDSSLLQANLKEVPESQDDEKHAVEAVDDSFTSAGADFELIDREPTPPTMMTTTEAHKISERDAFTEPIPEGLRRSLTDRSMEEDTEGGADEMAWKPQSADEYKEPTEEQLRKFLDAVLKVFHENQRSEALAKWDFNEETWEPEYDERAAAHPDDEEEDAMKDLFHPPRYLRYTAPDSEAYGSLALLAYWFANAPFCYVSTKLPVNVFEAKAYLKMREVQKLLEDVDGPRKRRGNVMMDIDE